MVIVLTSNYNAGILQLAVQMKNELRKIYGKTILFVPDESNLKGDDIETYRRFNSLLPFDKRYEQISRRIEKHDPELIFVCDSNLITSRIILGLEKNIPVCMVEHDITAHPNYSSAIVSLKEKVKKPYILKAWKRANKIILLSNHSYKGFKAAYPQYKDKAAIMRLGAHVPNATPEKPEEIVDETGYILFFGRIDKYKGLINLLKAYSNICSKTNRKLVIAGKGEITEEEENIIKTIPSKIIFIHRYISDGEMIWLFQNASCTVLPYIEASQSGVLSMSYYFGKPVIVSNLEGLTEFVVPGGTGEIFENESDLSNKILDVCNRAERMKKGVKEYYIKNLEWLPNLKSVLNDLIAVNR